MNHLFVPFGDLTNGTETYPGGRYLELNRTPTGIYDLDFNRAFHPFCYYNPQYRLSVSAARKPARDSDPGRRAHESGGTLTTSRDQGDRV